MDALPTACFLNCRLRSADLQRPDKIASGQASSPSSESQSAIAARLYSYIHDWEIRVLSVEPGNLGDPLSGSLHVATLIEGKGIVLRDQNVRATYLALSYVWGVPDFAQRIKINGELFPITTNVFHALQRLRDPEWAVNVWVDAICINQHDPGERAAQVRTMLLIFQKAHSVLAWLGEHSRYSPLAMRGLGLSVLSTGSGSAFSIFDNGRLCKKHAARFLNGLLDLALKPWFRRVWVRQEVWASRLLTVQCGNQKISWEDFRNLRPLVSWLLTHLPTADALIQKRITEVGDIEWDFRIASDLELLKRHFPDKPNGNLVEDYENYGHDIVNVLRRCTDCICSDPRDRIYAILGMTTVATSEPGSGIGQGVLLEIDYERHPALVFEDVTRYVIRRNRSLSVLYLDATFGTDVSGVKLHSWAIDWRKPTARTIWLDIYEHLQSSTASLEHAEEEVPDMDLIAFAGPLYLQGYPIGILKIHTEINVADKRMSDKPLSPKTRSKRVRLSHQMAERKSAQDTSDQALIASPTQPANVESDRGLKLFSVDLPRHLIPNITEGQSHSLKSLWITVQAAQPGDDLILVEGSLLPLIFRQNSSKGYREFVGPAMIVKENVREYTIDKSVDEVGMTDIIHVEVFRQLKESFRSANGSMGFEIE